MYINETNSTNSLLLSMLPQQEFFEVHTDFQTAGRGQMGNAWESQQTKNILLSVLLLPHEIHPSQQFLITMAVSLAVRNAIAQTTQLTPTIKWPNDIYIGDRKVAGILIELTLTENHIQHAIVGVGLNVNQTHFLSNAPNPTSLAIETGHTIDRETLLNTLLTEIKNARKALTDPITLHKAYKNALYRKQGFFPYVEREVSILPTANATGTPKGMFYAEIVEVDALGRLLLRDKENKIRTYHFKEIRWVI